MTRVLPRTARVWRSPYDAAQGLLPEPADTRLPAGFAVQLATGAHRSRNGRLMLGGSPPRLVRLTPAAARLRRRLGNIAYGTGLWAGAVRRHTAAPLLPQLAAHTARLALGPVPVPSAGQPDQPPDGTGG